MIDWVKTLNTYRNLNDKSLRYIGDDNYFDEHPSSHYQIYVICNNYKTCGDKGKWVEMYNYNYRNKYKDLCTSCIRKLRKK